MKLKFSSLKRELSSVVLILFSAVPLFFIGSLLDIFLTHLYSRFENKEAALPIISQWIYSSLAGYRFLAQEIMACFWLLMVICFIANMLIACDHQQFRFRFIYSFLFIWLLAIATASFIGLACMLPFDLLLARINGQGLLVSIIRIILLFEVILLVMIPVGLLIWRKSRANKQEQQNSINQGTGELLLIQSPN